MLQVLVLKWSCIIPNILQCPKDTVLSQSCCNIGFPWWAVWSSLGRTSCILGHVFSIFHTLFMDTIQCFWIANKIRKLYTMLILFLHQNFLVWPLWYCPVIFFLAFSLWGQSSFSKIFSKKIVHFLALSYPLYDVGSLF